MLVYEGERTAEKMSEFVGRHFKAPLIRIVSASKYSRLDRTLDEFLGESPSKLHCIYMANNGDNPSLDIKSISANYKEDVLIGFSGEASANVRKRYGIQGKDTKFICLSDQGDAEGSGMFKKCGTKSRTHG